MKKRLSAAARALVPLLPKDFDLKKLREIPEVTDDLLRLVLGAVATIVGRDVMRLAQADSGEAEDPIRLSTYLSCLNEIHAIRALLPAKGDGAQPEDLSEAQLIRLVTGEPTPEPTPPPTDAKEG